MPCMLLQKSLWPIERGQTHAEMWRCIRDTEFTKTLTAFRCV